MYIELSYSASTDHESEDWWSDPASVDEARGARFARALLLNTKWLSMFGLLQRQRNALVVL